jgi:hypothetical protein
MKSADDGFTLIESLSSIAITLALSAAVCMLFATLLSDSHEGPRCIMAAVQIARTDTFIRKKAAETFIPYWERGSDVPAVFTAQLLSEKKAGPADIINVENLYDSKNRIRGITVDYRIAGRQDIIRTSALFGSIPAVGTE